MSGYTLAPEELSAAARNMDQSEKNIKSMVDQLQNALQNVANHFNGDGATAFNALAKEIQTGGEQLQSSLRAAGENLKAAGVTYTQREQDHSDITSRLG
jgi:WXG100 family type VII secretion target